MKRWVNARTLQVVLCLLLVAIGIVTWRFTHSAVLCMAACVGFTAIWLAVGFWVTSITDKAKSS